MQTGIRNFGKEGSQQNQTITIETLKQSGLSDQAASYIQLAIDIGSLSVANAAAVTTHGSRNILKNSQVGIHWGDDIAKQGMPWENYVGRNLPADARLPPNFKTFDYFDSKTGTAISVKTLDTQTPSRVAKPKQIYSTMKNYIDKIVNFSGYRLSGKVLETDMIRQREIHLAIPAKTNAAQRTELQSIIEYGKTKNVEVKITEIQ